MKCRQVPLHSKTGLELDTVKELLALDALKPHQNVVRFLGVCDVDSKMCFVTEFCIVEAV